jgi:putative FmdB family regulatory protein
MPLYEYQCDACGQRFEVIQKYSDPTPDACRKCGKGPVHRLASSPAIQFKGSGFYINDYAKGNSGASASGTAKGDGDSKSSDNGSRDRVSKDGASKDSAGKGSAGNDSAGKTDSAKSESKTDSSSAAAPASAPAKPAAEK